MDASRPPTIDPLAAARWQSRPQRNSAWLHEEVARRMEQRLDWLKRQPRSWLHWEPIRGGLQAQTLLARRYPQARASLWAALASERKLAAAAQAKALPWWRAARWWPPPIPSQPASGVELLWANMCLHLMADPQDWIRQWQQALAVDGLLMFSCLGPDTVRELRALYQAQGWPAPAHEYTDMHDWGDMLVAAGYAEPVLDTERIELSFTSPERLLQELRELGRNLHPARFAGLRGRGWQRDLLQALGQLADPNSDGALKLSFEIIYGHAYKSARKLTVSPETRLSVDEMRATLRRSTGASMKLQ